MVTQYSVKAYVESIEDGVYREEPSITVTFRLEWPSGAIPPRYSVNVVAKYEDAVDRAWPSVVDFFNEIRQPDQIQLVREPNP